MGEPMMSEQQASWECSAGGCARVVSYTGRRWCSVHAGGRTEEQRIALAVEMRQGGLRFFEIARVLEVSPNTVSMYLFKANRLDLRCASPSQLRAWRDHTHGLQRAAIESGRHSA